MKFKNLLKFMLCLQFFLFLQNTALAEGGTGSFNKKFELALKHMSMHKSFELNFDQELYSALRDKVSQSQGMIKVKAPKSFRFEIQKPQFQLYVSNGMDFWKYTPAFKHAQHLSANTLELNYLSILTDPANIKKIYKISPWVNLKTQGLSESKMLPAVQSDFPPAERADVVSIKLEPKEDKQQKVLYAVLNVKHGLLDELRVVQLNGNRVRLLFSNSKDKIFDTKTFSFVPPQGIVVDSN